VRRQRGWSRRGGLLLLGLGLCLPAPASGQRHRTLIGDFPQVELAGIIHIEGAKKRVIGATVTLQDPQGKVVDEQSTSGEFHFEGVRKGAYTLVVVAQGYQNYSQTIDLTNFSGTYLVNITLNPSDSAETSTTDAPSRTDATAPKQALREWEKGVRASQGKKIGEARDHFERAIAIYPCYARAQTDLALTLMRLKDSAHSEASLRKAIECDPDYVESYLHLGRLLNAEQRYREARQTLEEGVRRDPNSWQLQFDLAQADEGLNNFPLAEQEFQRTLALGPDVSPDVHEKFASLYLKEKAYTKAYAEMQAYLQAAPDGRYAERVRTVMHQLESAGLAGRAETAVSSSPPKVNN